MKGSLAEVDRHPRFQGPQARELDLTKIRADFPALAQLIHGHPLVYLDNAASTQKPRQVIDALVNYYETSNANVHRGVHTLGDRSTSLFESARRTVQKFLGAAHPHEIVFVRGATEAVNLVASSFGASQLHAGDEVVVSGMEHHANIIPWQIACAQRGASLKVIPVLDNGDLDLEAYARLLNDRVKIVAISHVSNALGTINDVKSVITQAHERSIPVLVDGAQAVSHLEVDVQALDCDFYVLSGHKLYAPMGIGVLYGKTEWLEALPPWQSGGDMVRKVTFEATTYNDLPHKFEAGTPDVAGAVGLAAAIDYLEGVGRELIARHEDHVLTHAVARLETLPEIRLIGAPTNRAGVVSFLLRDASLSPIDLGSRLDLQGVAVRTGHHCCQPLMQRFEIPGTVRASVALYNTIAEVDQFVEALTSIVAANGSGKPRFGSFNPGSATIQYPAATAPSVIEAAEQLLDEFEELEGWAERYEFLIELGRKRLSMPREMINETNRVWGCQSKVYIAPRIRPYTDHHVEFLADSDSEIVAGLLALLQHLFSGQPAPEILAFDLTSFLAKTGLHAQLTTSRRTGLAEMIARLRTFASESTQHERT